MPVMAAPSTTPTGSPVSADSTTMVPYRSGSPRAGFSENQATVLWPNTPAPPSTPDLMSMSATPGSKAW